MLEPLKVSTYAPYLSTWRPFPGVSNLAVGLPWTAHLTPQTSSQNSSSWKYNSQQRNLETGNWVLDTGKLWVSLAQNIVWKPKNVAMAQVEAAFHQPQTRWKQTVPASLPPGVPAARLGHFLHSRFISPDSELMLGTGTLHEKRLLTPSFEAEMTSWNIYTNLNQAKFFSYSKEKE